MASRRAVYRHRVMAFTLSSMAMAMAMAGEPMDWEQLLTLRTPRDCQTRP